MESRRKIKGYTYILVSMLLIVISSGCNKGRGFSVIITSDLHYNAYRSGQVVIDSMITRFNSIISGDAYIGEKGNQVKSLFVLGDITDSGVAAEWEQYCEDFEINGSGDVRVPVYETFGNHDGNIDGVVRTGIKERNNLRKGKVSVSENGLFSSVDINNFHFVLLGIYPGNVWDPGCEWCKYFRESFREPQNSLDFLAEDLEKRIGKSGKPVVLLFHYGWDDFSRLWWTEKEQEMFYSVIKDYNIVAIVHGHDHAVDHYTWNGIDVWSAGSPRAGEKTGNFLLMSANSGTISVYKGTVDSMTQVEKDSLLTTEQ